MKRILNSSKKMLILLLFCSLTPYYSCKKHEKTYKPIELLKSDTRFLNVIKQNMAIIERVKDGKGALALISKPTPSIPDLEKFSVILGFKNLEEYSEFVKNQDQILLQLKEEYQLNELSQNIIQNIAIEAINSIRQSVGPVRANKLSSVKGGIQLEDMNNCERIRRNCLITVAATATAAHIACVAADLTVILGAICHGAAIAYQVAAGDTCNAQAQDCQGVVNIN